MASEGPSGIDQETGRAIKLVKVSNFTKCYSKTVIALPSGNVILSTRLSLPSLLHKNVFKTIIYLCLLAGAHHRLKLALERKCAGKVLREIPSMINIPPNTKDEVTSSPRSRIPIEAVRTGTISWVIPP